MWAFLGAALLVQGEASAQPNWRENWREYPSFEGADAASAVPPDWNVPEEFVVGRLMYPGPGGRRFGFGGGNWFFLLV